jgi:pimeloyl-ACP methyl ester carboxylesterase
LKKKIKNSTIFSIIVIGLLLVGTQFVTVVSSKKPLVTYDEEGEYSITIGKLGGARWALYMPDNWNGMLIIGCRGHMSTLPVAFPTGMIRYFARYFMNDLTRKLPDEWDDEKFAFAWSDYGEGGYCIKSGVIHTHQLTEYLIDNYAVSGKVFLYSLSMGGAIALTLAEKYPNLYSGVFDWFGTKDLTHSYYHKAAQAEQTTLQGIIDYFDGFDPPIPYAAYSDAIDESNYQDHIIGQEQTRSNIELECGGTPDIKPKAYERRSPVCNPEVSIPILVIHGTYDRSVPYVQSVAYCEAVNAVTEPDLCQLVTMEGKGHGGMWIFQNLAKFFDLVEWVEDLGT